MHGYSLSGFRLPLQDRDLLQRLNVYFDSLDARLLNGEGWVIFNAHAPRSTRIIQYLQRRLSEPHRATHFFVPWRDFSLTSYMVEVELQSSNTDVAALPPERKRELEIASKVSQQTMVRMVTDDLLIVPGVAPRHGHEVRYLAATIEARYRSRLATIMLTPDPPHQLERNVSQLGEHGTVTWEQLSQRLFETSLIAL